MVLDFIKFTTRFLFLLPILYLSLYPFEYNKDYYNYYNDYILGSFSYDIGYEWFSYFFREILNFSFKDFWYFIVFLEFLILSICYRNKYIFILAYLTVIYMSQFFFGTQVRFALASLLYLYSYLYVSGKKKKILYLICSLFHYGLFLIFSLDYISSKVKINNLRDIKLFHIFVIFIGFIVSYFLIENILTIISYTRFAYFTADSEFLQLKSLSSILYTALFLFLLIIFCYEDSFFLSKKIVKFSIILLSFTLVFSSIAVLSGRVFLFFSLLEPILIFYCLKSKGSMLFKILIVFMFLIKILFGIYNGNYHLSHMLLI